MMHSNNALISNLHHAYRNLTGFEIGLDMDRERRWYDWQKRGNTEADLAMVVAYLKAEIKKGNRNPGALKFNNLIGNPDHFEEDLAMVKALARKPKVAPGLREVLVCTGRDENHCQEQAPVKTPKEILVGARDVLASAKAFESFKRWRQETGL